MRNKLIFILSFFHFGIVTGQQIDSVKIIPQNPTTLDSIYVVTSVTMATTANGYLGYELSNSGATTTIKACYKHGMLDASETYIDTINLGVKGTGSYAINFIAYATYIIPCDPSDSSDAQINFSVTPPLQIEETENKLQFNVFPNPLNSTTTLEFQTSENTEVEIDLVDSQGRLVKSFGRKNFDSGNQKIILDLSDVAKGIYFIQLKTDGYYYQKKIIKE